MLRCKRKARHTSGETYQRDRELAVPRCKPALTALQTGTRATAPGPVSADLALAGQVQRLTRREELGLLARLHPPQHSAFRTNDTCADRSMVRPFPRTGGNDFLASRKSSDNG